MTDEKRFGAMNRRTFIKLAGAAGAVATVGTSSAIIKNNKLSAQEANYQEKFVKSVCLQCPGGCGIMARVVDGRAVKIEGNPLHPVNEGGICPKGANGLQALYDPDRIKGPMKRTNPEKGIDVDPGFVEISWDEAIDTVVNQLQKVKNDGKAHTFGILNGRLRGHTGTIVSDFATLYGTPNNIGHSTICADGSKYSKQYTDGNKDYNAYDYANANYIISFGTGFIEAFRPLSGLIKSWGKFRRGKANRGKFIQVDVRVSVTASKADEYLLVQPGTDGALAMGMVHTILTEGLWNREFVGDFREGRNLFAAGQSVNTGDFEEKWSLGLVDWWNNELKDYTPAKAAAISGVPAAKIIRIAREFATTQPGVAVMERGVGTHTNGTYAGMVIHSLNALVGSFYVKGGLFYQEKPKFGATPKVDDYLDDATKQLLTQPKIAVYQEVAPKHAKGDPYKLSTLMFLYTNPYFSTLDTGQVQEAFKDIFQISFSPFMCETVLYADVVLPSCTYLEMHQDDPIYPTEGYPVAGIRQPVVKPLYNTRQVDDVLIEIGRRMGGKMAEYFNALGSMEQILEMKAKGLGMSLAEWREKGVWYRKPYSYEYKHGVFYNKGVAMDAEAVQKEILKTPSGKFEFRSAALEEKSKNPYPHYEPSKFYGDAEHDLHFCTYKVAPQCEGRGSNQPYLIEMYGLSVKEGWTNWLEIHPDTAAARGIRDGDPVWVESRVGKIKTRAKVTDVAQPNVVNMPHALGRRAYGRWAKKSAAHGSYVNNILYNQSDSLSKLASFNDTKVKVYKA